MFSGKREMVKIAAAPSGRGGATTRTLWDAVWAPPPHYVVSWSSWFRSRIKRQDGINDSILTSGVFDRSLIMGGKGRLNPLLYPNSMTKVGM